MTKDGSLQGLIDLHVHTYPEISPSVHNSGYDDEWLAEASQLGMRAVCLKSHYWPTVGKAHALARQFPGIGVYGGITLNATVGGLNPFAVRVALESGAKVVWFPTWSATNDQQTEGYSRRVAAFYGGIPGPSLQVLDDRGSLLPEVDEILRLVAEKDAAIATGHLAVGESKVLVKAASERGVRRIVFTHALTAMVGASVDDQKRLADLGAFIEHCFLATMPMHQQLPPAAIARSIRAVGPVRCIISTDAIFSWNPTPPQLLRMFVATLAELGFSDDEIYLMARTNPSLILGLDEGGTEP